MRPGFFYGMKYSKGDKVKFTDAGGTAIVVTHEGELVRVEDSFGFEHEYHESELLPVQLLEVGRVVAKDAPSKPSAPAAQQVDRLMIDLHSHELLESTQGMTRYEILNEQINRAYAVVMEAKRRKVPKVLIIHGKGSGRLKDEVHQMLERIGGLNYYFADFSEGGYGATEVQILLSKH